MDKHCKSRYPKKPCRKDKHCYSLNATGSTSTGQYESRKFKQIFKTVTGEDYTIPNLRRHKNNPDLNDRMINAGFLNWKERSQFSELPDPEPIESLKKGGRKSSEKHKRKKELMKMIRVDNR